MKRWWLLGVLCALGCQFPSGGANRGARAPGSGRGGVDVSENVELALSADGEQLIYRHHDSLWWASLRTGQERPVKMSAPASLVAFFGQGRGFFLKSKIEVHQDKTASERLAAFVDERSEPAWEVTLDRADHRMVALRDGSGVALSGDGLAVVERERGKVRWSVPSEGGVVDLVEVGNALLLTESVVREKRPAQTRLRLLDTASGEVRCELKLDTCADQVAVSPDQRRVFLAPTFCGADPVSVIDLPGCFLKATLPGFGPVALTAQGRWAVAFADRDTDDRDSRLPALAGHAKRYHLMRIDPTSLAYETMPVGDWLPRYATTGGEATLLVDTSRQKSVQVRRVDLSTLTSKVVPGPAVPLGAYVLTPDGQSAFVLSHGLYVLRMAPTPELSSLPLTFLPVALNLTPDGKRVVLLDDEEKLHLLEVDTLRVTDLTLRAAP